MTHDIVSAYEDTEIDDLKIFNVCINICMYEDFAILAGNEEEAEDVAKELVDLTYYEIEADARECNFSRGLPNELYDQYGALLQGDAYKKAISMITQRNALPKKDENQTEMFSE